MKRMIKQLMIFSFLIPLVSILVGCDCCGWNLDKAIVEGYRHAGLDNSGEELVCLSEGDYEEVCAMFEKEDTAYYSDVTNRWGKIQEVIANEFGEDKVRRIDKTQWIGEPNPLLVKVYLDNTSSMKGYIKHSHVDDQTFVSVFHAVDDYLFRKGEETDVKSFYTQRNKEMKQDEIVELEWNGEGGMKDQLDHNRMAMFTDSYQLNDFLDGIVVSMANDNEHRHLIFFITDGIPSGSNENVKPGGTWNIDHKSELKNEIRDIAKKLADNGGATSIYQFEGEFYGDNKDSCRYWYHDNSSKPITTAKKLIRPFYVIVMGDAEMTEQFRQEVEKGLQNFKPLQQVHFAKATERTEMMVKMDGQIIDESDDGNFVIEAEGREKPMVSISIPLEALPASLQDVETLKQAITLKVGGKEKGTPKTEYGNVVYEAIKLDSMFNHVTIDVKNTLPTWVDSINVANDKDSKWDFKGTFNFLVLVEGLKEGFSGNEDYIFKMNKTIKINN